MVEFSIITPTCCRPRELQLLAERLLPQFPVDGSAEWLICDDGPEDESAGEMIKGAGPYVRRVAGPRRGPAANRNTGARAARGKWLLFLDDDCVPREGFLPAYREAMATVCNGEPVALEGPTHAGSALPSLLWEAPHSPQGGALISCNFAIPRELFLDAGLFDERFPMASFEDTEFAARLERMGVQVWFVPGAAVDHPLRPLPPATKRARRWEARVISSYDFGASTGDVLWRLPYHIAAVTQSRFRGQRWSVANLQAAFSYLLEVVLAILWVPGWVLRYRHAPRSPFWEKQVTAGKAPPRFGL